MRKNVTGQFVSAEMVSTTDGSVITTGTTTVYVTGDNGSQGVGTVGGGAATHKGNGTWTYAPSQAETNYNYVLYTFVNSSGVTALREYYVAETFADAVLSFDASAASGSGAAKALLNVCRLLLNKFTVVGGVLTVYKEDSVTIAFTRNLTSDGTASPIVGGS